MTTDVTSPVTRLLRGIASQHVETTRDAWRALVSGGEASTKAVLDKLDSPAWADNPRGPSGEYFGVLLAALHEIDPEVFETELERLQRSKLHALHRKTLRLLQARLFDIPMGSVAQDIPVYIAQDVEGPEDVLAALSKWAQTKAIDLQDVTRIDVIAEDGQQDYLGKYSLYFSAIILVWPKQEPGRIASWLKIRRAEHTFYHEVGHHLCGHLEGGSVTKQEKEADAFALRMMCEAHPALKLGVYLVYLPAKKIANWRRWRSGGHQRPKLKIWWRNEEKAQPLPRLFERKDGKA